MGSQVVMFQDSESKTQIRPQEACGQRVLNPCSCDLHFHVCANGLFLEGINSSIRSSKGNLGPHNGRGERELSSPGR